MSKQKEQPKPPDQANPLVPIQTAPDSVQGKMIAKPGDYWTSFPVESFADKCRLQKALVTQDYKIDEFLDKSIPIANIVAQRIQLVNEDDGELRDATRVVLISDNGQMFATVSEGAVMSLRSIIATFGQPPWKPALNLVFTRQKTRKGFFTYVVNVVE